jgi:tetratricopeptide (TPR) repeat protein
MFCDVHSIASMVKICLNMIVKNESKIIERLLQSVVGFIDSYCICDTGSSDGTEHIIVRFFERHGIHGVIVHEPFRNFGYNRSFALDACKNLPDADYILLMDADMQLQINPKLTAEKVKMQLKDDLYFVFQGNEFLYYKNVRIVKNRLNVSYWGVTHEFVKTPENVKCKYNQFDKSVIFIHDIGDGGSKQDKYTRDIELLKGGLKELPDNDRYLFYLANSYRDTGQFELAIETYKRRIVVGGWFEEIWQSHYNIGKCAKIMGNMDTAISHWLEAYNVFPQRLENIYEIIHYYRNAMKYTLAYQFYVLAADEIRRFKGILDFLFLEKDVYDWKLDYEMTVIAFYRNTLPFDICSICMRVLAYPYLANPIAANVMSNYKFYAKKVMDFSSKEDHSQKWTTLTQSCISGKYISADFVSSTPSFCLNAAGDLVSLIRYVNYRVAADGSYVNASHIETRNLVSIVDIKTHPHGRWIKKKEFCLKHNTALDNLYVGLEDVRLLSRGDKVYYNANRGLHVASIAVEHGEMDETGNTIGTVLREGTANSVEKNWVMFLSGAEEIKMVYGWSPLVIGSVVENLFVPTHRQDTVPAFFAMLRGSTNGITIGNEIWFVCHAVSFEDRRYYYHLFVVLDAVSFELKRYSPFFTFEGAIVEYCLGLLYFEEKGEFMVGYSLLDCQTKYGMIEKTGVESFMISI